MPLIDRVVGTLENVDTVQPVDLVITDGDDTFFPHGSPIPYDDSLQYLENLRASQVVLVSGNPDENLARNRAENIEATAFFIPPKRPKWIKYGLFIAACKFAQTNNTEIQRAVIMGNRWCMDIAMAKLALTTQHVANVEGVLVNRDEPHRENFDRYLIDPFQFIGATAVKKAGLDTHFRPRRDVNLSGNDEY
jgi:hypothetical protein